MTKFVFQEMVTNYREVGQPNPLRWVLLYRDGDNYYNQTNEMKCRDFFNDLAAKRNGREMRIYGFDTEHIKWNRFGMYVLLKNVFNVEKMCNNLEIINTRLKQDLACKLRYRAVEEDPTQLIIHIPELLFSKTYYISLVTMVIRLSNYDFPYTKWEDFFSDKAPASTTDGVVTFNPEARKYLAKKGFVLPENVAQYWMYAGATYHDQNAAYVSSNTAVHNNGILGWLSGMGVA